ncbi:MAG TPA: hypothetical protein VEU62_03865 [Bryobacterales bacterium]|nr:hypothetical protein [Bryobacterales bacterium]
MILILGVALTCLVGWLIIAEWVRCGRMPALALSFAAGAGVLSLEMFFFGLAHLPWNVWVLLLPWAPVAYLRLRNWRPALRPVEWPNWLEWIALAAMLAAPLAWLPYERVMPLNTRDWDAWAIWLFKAKAFFLDGNLAGFLGRAGEFLSQPSYPLLIPLYGTFLYRLAGAPADWLGKAISPCFFFALLGAFYYLARRFGSRPAALVFTAMLANLHMVNIVAFELAGYADTALSVYLLLGAGFLYAWWREGQMGDLALASLFSALAAWTKNEGLFFLAGAGTVMVGGLAWKRARDWRAWAAALAWPALAVVPWIVVRHIYGVPGSDVLAGGPVAWGNLWAGLAGILGQAAKVSVYNLTFWLVVASLLLAGRAGLGKSWWILPGLVLWQLAGLVGAYLSSRNDIQWWIGTSLDRILSQVAPLALLAAALVADAWLAAPAKQAEEAAAPAGRAERRRTQRKR